MSEEAKTEGGSDSITIRVRDQVRKEERLESKEGSTAPPDLL